MRAASRHAPWPRSSRVPHAFLARSRPKFLPGGVLPEVRLAGSPARSSASWVPARSCAWRVLARSSAWRVPTPRARSTAAIPRPRRTGRFFPSPGQKGARWLWNVPPRTHFCAAKPVCACRRPISPAPREATSDFPAPRAKLTSWARHPALGGLLSRPRPLPSSLRRHCVSSSQLARAILSRCRPSSGRSIGALA
jgi:hypothetical protein